MTDKKFKVAGVSKGKDQYKVRFANDMTRVKVLQKTDTDINMIELPGEMTKPELVTYLKTTDLYNNTEYRIAIDTADAKYNGTVTAKVTRAKASKPAKPSMASIKAKAAEAVAGTDASAAETAPAVETPAAEPAAE